MTYQQIYWFTGLALALTIVAAILTRATGRRILGATAGAAVCGPLMLAIVEVCERAGLWRMNYPREPAFLIPAWVSIAVCGYVFLLTWRIARRYGRRGLTVSALVIAALGPVRDSMYMAKFPEWGGYAPGIAPMIAISVAYLLLGVAGHGTMRLLAGPAGADRLIARPQ